jgi:hypothetical protein
VSGDLAGFDLFNALAVMHEVVFSLKERSVNDQFFHVVPQLSIFVVVGFVFSRKTLHII